MDIVSATSKDPPLSITVIQKKNKNLIAFLQFYKSNVHIKHLYIKYLNEYFVRKAWIVINPNHSIMKHINSEDITRKHDLTVEEVKSFPMFAHFTDEQAMEVIRTLKTFVDIALYCYKKEKEKQGKDAGF